jgi:hypothetical protein
MKDDDQKKLAAVRGNMQAITHKMAQEKCSAKLTKPLFYSRNRVGIRLSLISVRINKVADADTAV